MPRTLFDESGNEVETLEESEIEALKEASEKAAKLEEELKLVEDKSAGVKSLREALKRKESLIADLQKKLEVKPEEEVGKESKQEPAMFDEEKIRSMTRSEASRVLMETEISKRLSEFSDDDKGLVKKVFDKLTSGEELNMETVGVFLEQASRAVFPQGDSRARGFSHSAGGRPPHLDTDKKKSFADTDEGKELAARMGFTIDNKKK